MTVTVKLSSLGQYLPAGSKRRQTEMIAAEGATAGDLLTNSPCRAGRRT